MPPLSVVPTCADLDRFRPSLKVKTEGFTFGYVGSIGTWYLFDEILECFRILRTRRPDARLLIVNRNEQSLIRQKLGSLPLTRAASNSSRPITATCQDTFNG